MEFRIKEVHVPFNDGTTRTYFYPQIKDEKQEKVSGYLWWKKYKMVEFWKPFHKDSDGIIFVKEYRDTKLLVCKTKEEAQGYIYNYKKRLAVNLYNFYAKVAADYEDAKLVTYHPITNEKS